MKKLKQNSRPSFISQTDLTEWLNMQGVSTDQWGQGEAKTIDDLWHEIQAGESVLQSDPLQRSVRVVSVLIWHDGKLLIETAQSFRDGRMRYRNRPPSEKLKRAESAESGAIRCLAEELAVSAENVTLLPATQTKKIVPFTSDSYPTLPSQMELHTIQAIVDTLPNDSFWTHNAAPKDPILRHQWTWLPTTDTLSEFV